MPAFENENKYTAWTVSVETVRIAKIPTKKEPIRTRGFTLHYNNKKILYNGSEVLCLKRRLILAALPKSNFSKEDAIFINVTLQEDKKI